MGLEWVRASPEQTEQGVRHISRPLEEHLAKGILSSFTASTSSTRSASMRLAQRLVCDGWLAATIDLTVRSARLTSGLLAARLGALHAMGLLALVFLTHRLARLLDMTAQLIITPCDGCVGCVRVLGPCVRAILSLALLTGPLVLLLELMTRLGITPNDVSYRIPRPALFVDRAASSTYNAALPDAIDLASLAIGDGLLFLCLLLLAVCGLGRPPLSHEHIYAAKHRRVEEAERLLSDAVLAQCEAAHERKRWLHLVIPQEHVASDGHPTRSREEGVARVRQRKQRDEDEARQANEMLTAATVVQRFTRGRAAIRRTRFMKAIRPLRSPDYFDVALFEGKEKQTLLQRRAKARVKTAEEVATAANQALLDAAAAAEVARDAAKEALQQAGLKAGLARGTHGRATSRLASLDA